MLGFECTINSQNFIKIAGAIFEKMKILIFFLMWTNLNFEGRSKTKKCATDICKGTLGIEFEQEWSVSLSATLGDATDRKLKNIFLVTGILPGNADSVIFLGF